MSNQFRVKKLKKIITMLATGLIVSGGALSAQAEVRSIKQTGSIPLGVATDINVVQSSDTEGRDRVKKVTQSPAQIRALHRKEVSKQTLPEVSDVKVFKLMENTDGGFNAVTQVVFKPSEKFELREFSSTVDGDNKLHFNDAGVTPDLKADDGVFSAFSHIDFRRMALDESRVIEKLKEGRASSIPEFSGRTVASISKFDISELLVEIKEARPTKVTFGKNIVGLQVQSIFNHIAQVPFTGDEDKVLGVNATSVVAHPDFTFDPCDTDGTGNDIDADADWSFKTLMSNLNNTTLSDQEFIHEWLRNWMVNGNVNGFNIPARPSIVSFFPGWDGVNASTLNIDNLPFRLLSIMNRLDLAKVSYASATQGETRFVFGLLNSCSPAQMTVIFEYGDTAMSCSTIKTRAQQWLDLDNFALGSVDYMSGLKAITDDVTLAPTAASALNQLRTNEISFGSPWSLREFIVDGGSGLLAPTTIKQTPDASFRFGNPDTAQFMEDNAEDILCETHLVEEQFDGIPFLGASIEYMPNSFWKAPTVIANMPAAFPSCHTSNTTGVSGAVSLGAHIDSEVRHKLSLNTCDDCHSGETGTSFTHVSPVTRSFSGFMTGNTVNDPWLGSVIAGGIERSFDDLQRRGQIVQDLAVRQCSGGLILGSALMQKSLPRVFSH